jgi:hypothetical protein
LNIKVSSEHNQPGALNDSKAISEDEKRAQQEAYYLDQVLGNWDEDLGEVQDPSLQRSTPHIAAKWESREQPPAASDPHPIPDNFN